MRKNWPPWLLTVSSPWAHGEFTVSSRWPKWSQPAVTEPWPGPWLSCDLAVTSPWLSRDRRDGAVTSPWLSCDLAVTELWPSLAVNEPWSLGPGAVTTVVTVSSPWAHGDNFFLMGVCSISQSIHPVLLSSAVVLSSCIAVPIFFQSLWLSYNHQCQWSNPGGYGYIRPGPWVTKNIHAKIMFVDKQTWHLIGWEHNCQPIRGHVRKSLANNMGFNMRFS